MSLGVLRQRHSISAIIQSIWLICTQAKHQNKRRKKISNAFRFLQKQIFDYKTEAILALVQADLAINDNYGIGLSHHQNMSSDGQKSS